jgi:hypothetical protein
MATLCDWGAVAPQRGDGQQTGGFLAPERFEARGVPDDGEEECGMPSDPGV